MAAFLLNIPNEQTIETVNGRLHCLAYSHPDYYTTRTLLAADFGGIGVGDQLILCSGSEVKSLAQVTKVLNTTDLTQRPVRVLQGPVVARFPNVSVGSAMKRAKAHGLVIPRLINPALTGFKQNAFCEEVSPDLLDELKQSWP